MLRILDVPECFLPQMPIKYPPHQSSNPMIEQRCFEYFIESVNQIESDYIYVPIQWTSFHLINDYGKNLQPLIDYYSSVLSQYPEEKFFTIVQWDGGTLVPLDNCKIFACSGSFSSPIGKNSIYEPVPLLCDPHPISDNFIKKYKAVFSGRITHNLREKMFEVLSDLPEYKLYNPGGVGVSDNDVEIFRNLICNSLFGLCPRGYGPTSFRIYETIQMGSIPIIISDELWIPFEDYIDWNRLALIVNPSDLDKIPQLVDKIIDSGNYQSMLEYGKFCYENYFSADGIPRTIEKIISK